VTITAAAVARWRYMRDVLFSNFDPPDEHIISHLGPETEYRIAFYLDGQEMRDKFSFSKN